MSESVPRISLLIPAYNEEVLISSVLDRARECFASVGCSSYEVIVCDNNSTDATAALAREKGAMVVHEPHNQIGRARNTAAKSARGEWLIFLDADTYLSPELLSATLAALDSGKSCGGGTVIRFDGGRLSAGAHFILGLWNRISTVCQLAAGSYIFCRREAWSEVGGFDERVYAGEELFFSHRLKRWAKLRGLEFRILTKTPIRTSARKMEWYGQWQLLWRVILLAWPGAMMRRDLCGLWYVRPAAAPVVKIAELEDDTTGKGP